MFHVPSFLRRGPFSLKPAHAIAILAIGASGCSADVTRFDSTSFAFDDPPSAATDRPSSGFMDDAAVVNNAPPGPYGVGARGVDSSPLAEPIMAEPLAAPAPAYEATPFRTAAAPTAAAPVYAETAGQTIEVQRGDTLYGLSRRHNVSLNELMRVNGLTDTMLRPGQRLQLPGSGEGDYAQASPAPARSSERPVETAAVATPSNVSGSGASYTVRPGDSLYAIARNNGVSLLALQNANDISDPRRLQPGQVLIIPTAQQSGSRDFAARPASPAPVTMSDESEEPFDTTARAAQAQTPTQVAALTDRPAEMSPAPAAQPEARPEAMPSAERQVAVAAPTTIVQGGDGTKLRWPVRGQIIAPFGGRPDGTHNDGINVAVPLGADVQAAESGIVAYAGSELKGYGNLILVRHENGWVTAYAHNDELLVKRGDKVRRGQTIAKAGKSGAVDRPQVHFELRQGSKPVDPTPYMEPL
jgi:murein DD-endopeptidase MepM/ murein hydrolase activator NlpD